MARRKSRDFFGQETDLATLMREEGTNSIEVLFKRTAGKGLFFLVVAAVCLYFASTSGRREALLAQDGITAPGKIVAMRYPRFSGRHARRCPVVRFVDEEGISREVMTRRSEDIKRIDPVGRPVTVLYARSNPEIAEVQFLHDTYQIPTARIKIYVNMAGRSNQLKSVLHVLCGLSVLFALYHFSAQVGEWLWGDN